MGGVAGGVFLGGVVVHDDLIGVFLGGHGLTEQQDRFRAGQSARIDQFHIRFSLCFLAEGVEEGNHGDDAEADENGEYTDEAKAAAKARAEEIYAEWKAGDATEESFAALAEEYSEDTGSNTNGGLYDSVRKGQMVEEFDAFCFGGHKSGDTAIVYGESAGSYAGYHIMYYVGEGQLCSESIAESDMRSADLEEWLDSLIADYEPVKSFWFKLVG